MSFRLPNDLVFDNRYAQLGDAYHSRVKPTPFEKQARFISINEDVTSELGLDAIQENESEWLAYLSGSKHLPNGNPIAMRYAGHQFGHYVPQLGDGRAILLGQLRNKAGKSYDLHLKGAGLTPYSRDGDGRAVLRSSIREYLCGEAMHGLGIPTTRSLCLIGSDEEVYREQIETGAMLVRVAPSHVRFGSFELFYYRQEHEYLKPLADHVIDEHFAEFRHTENPYVALLNEAIQCTARLMAQWQSVGFAHGVMNTDNMSILGLTLDYGPYGFLDTYDPEFICNHSDHMGRYAFDRQPQVGLWNLSCLAQALLPLLDTDPNLGGEIANDSLSKYQGEFETAYTNIMRDKLGLIEPDDRDDALAKSLLDAMTGNQVDYTIFFRALSQFKTRAEGDTALRNHFINRGAFDHWSQDYLARLKNENSNDEERKQKMNKINPRYVLRNYMAQACIEKAESGDYSEIERLLDLLKHPCAENPTYDSYAKHPPEWADRISVSCSS